MQATLHLTKANLRKGKDLAIIFVTILTFSSMLLLLGIMTIRDYKQNIRERVADLHTPDAIFTAIMDEHEADVFMQELDGDELTSSSYRYPIQYVYSDLLYGQGKMSLNITILPRETLASGNDFEMVEEVKDIEHPIYLPYIFKDGGGYALYDTFDCLQNADGEHRYQVAGFYDSFLLGSINNGIVSVALPQVAFDALSLDLNHQKDGFLIAANLHDETQLDAYGGKYTDIMISSVSKHTIVNSTTQNITMKARTITADIGSYILLIFSCIITAIALLMVRYRIHNSVEENGKNIGALKSLGYTNKQIQHATILQFSCIGLIGTIVGNVAGYVLLPLLANAYSVQTGILWQQGFDMVSTLATFMILEGFILCTCIISTRKIQKLTVLKALRFGIATHNFKKNHVPLTKQGSLPYLLGCKFLFQQRAQTLIMGMISLMISFCGVFAWSLNYNMTFKPDIATESMMGEKADILLRIADYDLEKAKEEIAVLPTVSQVLYYTQTEAFYEDHQVMANVTNDYSLLRTKGMMYEGRYPKYADEIAINGLMAKEKKIAIGDEITLSSEGRKQAYLVTGYIQSTYYMGYDVSLREDGIRLLQPTFKPTTLYVYANGDKASLMQQIIANYTSYGVVCNDFDNQIQATMGVFQTIIAIFTLLISIISLLLISLILYLMTQTILVHRHQEFGIQKAIGFTTKQLQLQIAISFLPEICLGSILGATLATYFINPICSSLFSTFGWMDTSFIFPWYYVVGMVLLIMAIAFTMAMVLTRKIRHITPYSLLIE